MKHYATSLLIHGAVVGGIALSFYTGSLHSPQLIPASNHGTDEIIGNFEASTPTAPGPGSIKKSAPKNSATPSGTDTVDPYLLSIRTAIERETTFTFPKSRLPLKAVVELVIKSDGNLHNVTLVEESRDPVLNRNLLATVKRAAPFPKPAENFLSEDGVFRARLPFEFQTKRENR